MSDDIPLNEDERDLLELVHIWEYGHFDFVGDALGTGLPILSLSRPPIRPVPLWLVRRVVGGEETEFLESLYFLERCAYLEFSHERPSGLLPGKYGLARDLSLEIVTHKDCTSPEQGTRPKGQTTIKLNGETIDSWEGAPNRETECCSLIRAGLKHVLTPPSEEPDRRYDNVAFSCAQLASLFNVDKEALRKRLERMPRELDKYRVHLDESSRRSRESRQLYILRGVRSTIEDLKTSSRRPTDGS